MGTGNQTMETYMRLVIILLLTLLMPALSLPLPKELQGNIVPDFFVLAMDNETELNRDNLAKEVKKTGAKRIVFSFFASWCTENCGPEFIKLKENSGILKEKGVSVYLIDVGEKIMQKGKEVSDFVSKYAGDAFPFYFNQNASLLKNFGIIERNATQFSLPVILVMDANLKVLDVFTGVGNDFPQTLWNGL